MPDTDYDKLLQESGRPVDYDALLQGAGQPVEQAPAPEAPAPSRGGALETAKDFAVGVGSGLASDWDDEIYGLMHGIGDALAGGSFSGGRQVGTEDYRQTKATARDRSPTATFAGNITGAVGQLAATGGAGRAASAAGKGVQMLTGGARAAEGASRGARAATAVGNVLAPAAIQGAGAAESMEDIPGEVGKSVATAGALSGIVGVPGAAVRGMRQPGAQKFGDRVYANASLKAGGVNQANRTKLIETHGSPEAAVAAREALGIGTGFVTPGRVERQADEAAQAIAAQREAIQGRAPGAMVPSSGIADRLDALANKLPQPTGKKLERLYRQQARDFRETGNPVYETTTSRAEPMPPYPPQGTADDITATVTDITGQPRQLPANVDSRALPPPRPRQLPPGAQSDALVAGPEISETRMVGREMPLSQVIENMRLLREESRRPIIGLREGRAAQVSDDTASALNDAAEETLNKINPGLGSEWRNVKRGENTAITARKMAEQGQYFGSKLDKFGRIAAGLGGGAAFGFGSTMLGVPALVGAVAMDPNAQRMFGKAVSKTSQALQSRPATALGRVLNYAPSAGQIGRAGAMAVTDDGEESIRKVQEAALQGPEEMQKAHFREMLTNPDYNRFALDTQESP